jgi:hypothetical protein
MIQKRDAKIGPIKIRVSPSTYCHPVFLLVRNKYQETILMHSSPPNPGDPPKPTPLAYAMNADPDNSDTPMINFCAGFFARRSLADAITYGKALVSPNNLRLANYDNRAQTFLVS